MSRSRRAVERQKEESSWPYFRRFYSSLRGARWATAITVTARPVPIVEYGAINLPNLAKGERYPIFSSFL
jgi:hypothetical protein